jgi:biotin-dependent carboxylase-like uncharacterized protein
MSVRVIQPGLLSLLQDAGRFGQHHLGLTTGGPLDPEAFYWCNRLLQNPAAATAIEISFGGLELEVRTDTLLCVTGADMPLTINAREQPSWFSHRVRAGDRVALGFAQHGCRAYLGVSGGFDVAPMFGSTATVPREGLGGLRGSKLAEGDDIPCSPCGDGRRFYLPPAARPRYGHDITLRVIPGYQQAHFNRQQQRRFFGHSYRVSDRSDRMGYRLEGPAIACDISGILSEGICLGAIQVPADGQPIVLLNDRQTIGGYPKIGAALSVDLAKLAQLRPGATVHFAPVTPHGAHNALHLAHYRRRFQALSEAP